MNDSQHRGGRVSSRDWSVAASCRWRQHRRYLVFPACPARRQRWRLPRHRLASADPPRQSATMQRVRLVSPARIARIDPWTSGMHASLSLLPPPSFSGSVKLWQYCETALCAHVRPVRAIARETSDVVKRLVATSITANGIYVLLRCAGKWAVAPWNSFAPLKASSRALVVIIILEIFVYHVTLEG